MIRQAVIAEMERRGVGQRDLADLTGIAQPNLSRWLSGRASASERTIERVMQALGLEVRRGARRCTQG